MKLKHIDHIGVIVHDLQAAKQFFVDLGFEIKGEAEEQGELLDRVTGVTGAHSQLVFLTAPDGQINLELAKFINPATKMAEGKTQMYEHGYQHIALQVEGIDEIVADLKTKGYDIFVDVYNYQDMFKLCYFRGPEGIIVELAEQL